MKADFNSRWIDRAVAIITLLTVLVGWGIGYGKLSQKVDDLAQRLDRIERYVDPKPVNGRAK